MTDYKNELRSVLYDFLGDYKDKRYLSEGNTDRALADIEALLSKRELEARVEENQRMVNTFEHGKGIEMYLDRINQLGGQDE